MLQAARLLTALYEVELSHRRTDLLRAGDGDSQSASVRGWGRRLRMTLTTGLGQALVADRYDKVRATTAPAAAVRGSPALSLGQASQGADRMGLLNQLAWCGVWSVQVQRSRGAGREGGQGLRKGAAVTPGARRVLGVRMVPPRTSGQ